MEFKPLSVDQYLSLTFPDNDLVASGILTKQSRLVIGGHPGIGKSIVANQMGVEISMGKKCLDRFPCRQCSVIYIQEEIGPKSYQLRLEKVASYYQGITDFHVMSAASFSFDDTTLVLQLQQYIRQLQAQVVIFDPLYKMHTRREGDPTEMTQLTSSIDRIITNTGIAIILVHHLRKPFMTYRGEIIPTGIMDFRGAIVAAWADSMMLIEETGVKDRVKVSFPKLRNAPEEVEPMHLRLDRTHLRFGQISSNGVGPVNLKDEVLIIVRENPNISEGNVINRIRSQFSKRVDSRKVKSTLEVLRNEGLINLVGNLLSATQKQIDPWDTEW